MVTDLILGGEETVRAGAALDDRLEPATDLDDVEWQMLLGRGPAALPVSLARQT